MGTQYFVRNTSAFNEMIVFAMNFDLIRASSSFILKDLKARGSVFRIAVFQDPVCDKCQYVYSVCALVCVLARVPTIPFEESRKRVSVICKHFVLITIDKNVTQMGTKYVWLPSSHTTYCVCVHVQCSVLIKRKI